MSEFEMLRRLRALRVEHQPPRDLWPAIAAGLEEPAPWRAKATPRRLLWPWAAAATVAVAVGMGFLIARQFHTMVPAGESVASTSARTSAVAWGATETRAMQLAYEGALDSALGPARRAAIEHRRPDLGAAVREIDQAALAIKRELASHPGAPYLLSALKRAQDQRLRVARLEAELG